MKLPIHNFDPFSSPRHGGEMVYRRKKFVDMMRRDFDHPKTIYTIDLRRRDCENTGGTTSGTPGQARAPTNHSLQTEPDRPTRPRTRSTLKK